MCLQLISKGAIIISKMMIMNRLLQELYMCGNDIGDDGVSAISEALGDCRINILNLRRCNITRVGAILLAAALSSNYSIRGLWLRDNALTIEGALLIVKSAIYDACSMSIATYGY